MLSANVRNWLPIVDKRFASMLETMLSGEKWSLRPWKKTLEDQLGSWLMYVPGMKDSSETKELNSYKGIMTHIENLCVPPRKLNNCSLILLFRHVEHIHGAGVGRPDHSGHQGEGEDRPCFRQDRGRSVKAVDLLQAESDRTAMADAKVRLFMFTFRVNHFDLAPINYLHRKSLGEHLPTTEPELRLLQENDVRLRAIGSKMYDSIYNSLLAMVMASLLLFYLLCATKQIE